MQKIGRLTPSNHVLIVVDDAGDRERLSSAVLDSAALAVYSSVPSAQLFSLFSLISLGSPTRPIVPISSNAKVPRSLCCQFVRTGPGLNTSVNRALMRTTLSQSIMMGYSPSSAQLISGFGSSTNSPAEGSPRELRVRLSAPRLEVRSDAQLLYYGCVQDGALPWVFGRFREIERTNGDSSGI